MAEETGTSFRPGEITSASSGLNRNNQFADSSGGEDWEIRKHSGVN
jgi:hypothetical protein